MVAEAFFLPWRLESNGPREEKKKRKVSRVGRSASPFGGRPISIGHIYLCHCSPAPFFAAGNHRSSNAKKSREGRKRGTN